ncbi:hypothetical protein DUM87_25355 [Escherichia coli]|nr:hypothetical protein [Escherichia coli]
MHTNNSVKKQKHSCKKKISSLSDDHLKQIVRSDTTDTSLRSLAAILILKDRGYSQEYINSLYKNIIDKISE